MTESNNIEYHINKLLNILIFSTIYNILEFNFYSKTKNITDYLIDNFIISLSITYLYCMVTVIYSVYNKVNLKYSAYINTDSEEESEEDNLKLQSENLEKDKLGLSERIKIYERLTDYESHIKSYENYIIRIDGRGFSKLTQYFSKPYDENFSEIMLKTANDLLNEFHPTLIHVHSDEISLVFKKMESYEQWINGPKNYYHIFKGKISKLLSITASFASSKFYYNLGEFINNLPKNDTVYSKLTNDYKSGILNIAFDSRAIIIPEKKDYDIINYLIWRSRIDGYRNTVAMYANSIYNTNKIPINELDGLSTEERITKLKDLNVNFDKLPNHYKFGWIIKNMDFNIQKINKMKFMDNYKRKNIVAMSFKLIYNDEIKEQLLINNNYDFDKFKLLTGNFEVKIIKK